jgi:hypothetical protein
MYDERGDLTSRTVVIGGDIDQMGVVVYDNGGERVKVSFGERGGYSPHYERGGPGEYVNRSDLEDVTDSFDYAREWGFTEDED